MSCVVLMEQKCFRKNMEVHQCSFILESVEVTKKVV